MMGMYFTVGVELTNILFKGWNTYKAGDIILAAFLGFFFTVIFEFVKGLKLYIASRRKQDPLTYGCHDDVDQSASSGFRTSDSTGSQAELLSSLRIPTSLQQIRNHRMKLFVVESVLHTVTFAYGYILMLLVMTYNVWLLLSVICGSGLGYFIVIPVGQHISSKYVRTGRYSELSSRCENTEVVESNVNSTPAEAQESTRLFGSQMSVSYKSIPSGVE